MIIPFEKLKRYDFALSSIRAIRQMPKYRELQASGRICNGFIYVVSGECRYKFEGGSFTLRSGEIAYLPYGSHHTLKIESDAIVFYRIDFTLKIERELAYFSDRPLKFYGKVSPECAEAIVSLTESCGMFENSIIKTQKLCTVLASLQSPSENRKTNKLAPALIHLQEYAFEDINCGELAKLCFLSTSRFYEMFKEELGMTPLEYRNELLIKRAKTLLSAGDISVNEVALSIGFENTAYFSRFFKKQVGISPSEYVKKLLKNT